MDDIDFYRKRIRTLEEYCKKLNAERNVLLEQLTKLLNNTLDTAGKLLEAASQRANRLEVVAEAARKVIKTQKFYTDKLPITESPYCRECGHRIDAHGHKHSCSIGQLEKALKVLEGDTK